jgi:hypothetical protein
MGITNMLSNFINGYIINNIDKGILLISLNPEEILNKIKDIYLELPFYLKVGVLAWNKYSIKFDNGMIIKSIKYNDDSIFSRNWNLVIMDQILNFNVEQFKILYSNLLPVLSILEDTKLILTSSSIKDNEIYHRFFTNETETLFKKLIYHYSLIPDRDENWKNEQIKIKGVKLFNLEDELILDNTKEEFILTTNKYNEIKEKIYTGSVLKEEENIFFNSDVYLLKAGLNFSYTEEELQNINDLKNNNITLDELIPNKLREHQLKMYDVYNNEKYAFILTSLQMGSWQPLQIYLYKFLFTNNNKHIIYYHSNISESIEFFDSFKKLYYSLPVYLKLGIIIWNNTTIKFSNGSSITVKRNNKILLSDKQDIIIFENDQREYKIFNKILDLYLSMYPDSKIFLKMNGLINIDLYDNYFISEYSIFKKYKFHYSLFDARDEKWKEEQIKSFGIKDFNKYYDLKI